MWAVKRTNKNYKEVNEFFTNLYGGSKKFTSDAKYEESKQIIHYPPLKEEKGKTTFKYLQKNYKLVSLQEMKELVQSYTTSDKQHLVSLYQFHKIIEIACDIWKAKLEVYARKNLRLDTAHVYVYESFIEEMLKASSDVQKDVILKVFPKYEDKFKFLREAKKRGQTIQIYNTIRNQWEDEVHPFFNLSVDKYRVKPEKEYIPFTFEDRELFRDKWLRRKSDKAEFRPSEIYLKSIYFQAGNGIEYPDALRKFEFLDGTPFGKLK